MLSALLPFITRQAHAMIGEDAVVRINGDVYVHVDHGSFEGGYLEVTLEDWMELVAQHLEGLVLNEKLHGF